MTKQADEYHRVATATASYYTTAASKERIARIAKALDRSRSWVINQALTIGLPAIERDAGIFDLKREGYGRLNEANNA